jgi:hypothetical protein
MIKYFFLLFIMTTKIEYHDWELNPQSIKKLLKIIATKPELLDELSRSNSWFGEEYADIIAEQWSWSVTIYQWSNPNIITKYDDEWLLEYHDPETKETMTATVVRRDKIPESFGGMENVKECETTIEATDYLKTEWFAEYAEEYADVFAYQSWFIQDGLNNHQRTRLFEMIDAWSKAKGIPYVGWHDSYGKHLWVDKFLYAWLPVRVARKFVYVWSNSGYHEADFYYGNEDDALVSLLQN